MNEENNDPEKELRKEVAGLYFRSISAVTGIIVITLLALFIWRMIVSEESHGEDIGLLFIGFFLLPIIFIAALLNVIMFFRKTTREQIFGMDGHYFEKTIHIIFLCVSVAVLAYPIWMITYLMTR